MLAVSATSPPSRAHARLGGDRGFSRERDHVQRNVRSAVQNRFDPSAAAAACFTVSFPVRNCDSMLRRMFPFSTLTQFLPSGRRAACSSLFVDLVRRRVSWYSGCSPSPPASSRPRSRERLDPVRGQRLVRAADGTARSDPPRKPGMTLPASWLGITNCPRDTGVLLADAAREPRRADDRRRLTYCRTRHTGIGPSLERRLVAREAAA